MILSQAPKNYASSEIPRDRKKFAAPGRKKGKFDPDRARSRPTLTRIRANEPHDRPAPQPCRASCSTSPEPTPAGQRMRGTRKRPTENGPRVGGPSTLPCEERNSKFLGERVQRRPQAAEGKRQNDFLTDGAFEGHLSRLAQPEPQFQIVILDGGRRETSGARHRDQASSTGCAPLSSVATRTLPGKETLCGTTTVTCSCSLGAALTAMIRSSDKPGRPAQRQAGAQIGRCIQEADLEASEGIEPPYKDLQSSA